MADDIFVYKPMTMTTLLERLKRGEWKKVSVLFTAIEFEKFREQASHIRSQVVERATCTCPISAHGIVPQAGCPELGIAPHPALPASAVSWHGLSDKPAPGKTCNPCVWQWQPGHGFVCPTCGSTP